MFDWHDFFGALFFFTVMILLAFLLSFGLYLLCEIGNAWGFAIIVVCIVLGGSIAVGFGL